MAGRVVESGRARAAGVAVIIVPGEGVDGQNGGDCRGCGGGGQSPAGATLPALGPAARPPRGAGAHWPAESGGLRARVGGGFYMSGGVEGRVRGGWANRN